MPAGAPYGNRNAEKWTLKEAIRVFDEAIELSGQTENVRIEIKKNVFQEFEQYKFDFIGEIAREIKLYKSIFTELVKKFPELQHHHKQLIENLEANCFCNSKKGLIREATAIVNLKSNHHWTDRNDQSINIEGFNKIQSITFDE